MLRGSTVITLLESNDMHRSVLALIAISGVAFAASDPGTFNSLDIFELEVASDPQISPDGANIVYVRQSMDIMTDRLRSNIWLVSGDGRRHRPLLSATDDFSSPRWSPQGDRIAYISSAEGRGPQLYVRWMDSGQTALLTNLRKAPTAITWSPNGTQIAFSMFLPGKEPKLAEAPATPEGAEWAPPVRIIDRLVYRADGRGFLDVGNTHIFVVPAEGGTARQLTSGDYDHSGPLSWSPDGSTIAFSASRIEDHAYKPLEAEIWTVDLEDGSLTQLTDRVGPDTAPTYSPDGSTIAYRGFDDRKMGYHNTVAYVMDANGDNQRALTAGFDRSIDDLQWAGSSKRLYVLYDDRGDRHIATLSMQGDIESQVHDVGGASLGRPYTSGGFSVSRKGTFAYTAGTKYRPADIAVARRGAAARKLTHLNDDLFAHKSLGQVEAITWSSPAGNLEIQGWIVTPPDFDAGKKYPLILEIHGGPFAAYGPHFSAEIQRYAAAGYVVLFTNPRGSTSYGDEFANTIHHNYPGQDYDDLMSGVDAVIAKGYIDEKKLYVTGGSGGGVLTAWIVGKTDRFRAAVVAKPVINWISTSLTTDISAFMPAYWFEKAPWEDPDAYWARSPLSLVGNVTTPTMLVSGEQDYRTPIGEAEQYYQALKLRKIETALVRFPEASHGIASRPSHLIAKIDNILAWFEKYQD